MYSCSKITPLIAKLQQECWDGYVSTGRGCQTLFQLIDTDSSGTITWAEIRFFLENVRQVNSAGVNTTLQCVPFVNLIEPHFEPHTRVILTKMHAR